MKFATAVSVLTASTVAPRCFATVPTQGVSRQQQSHNGNNIRRRIAAATTGGRQKTTKKNRSTRQQQEDKHSQFLRMRSPSTTLKNRGGLDRMAEIRTTTVECDPTSSHADIGILCGSSTSPQSNDLRVSCQEDLNSSLGGFCTEQVPLSRQLEEYISAEDMYYWCNDASYANWNCNCDGWDETNIMGNITECSYQYCSDCDGGNCSEDSFWVYINDTGRVWKECYDYGTWELCLEGNADYTTVPKTYSYDCTFQYKGKQYCCYFDETVDDDECGFRACEGSPLPFEICDLLFACPDLDSGLPWFPTISPTASPTGKPTTSPTGRPTTSPTANPTTGPTAPPIALPTESPVAAATEAPTKAPTGAPTASPSMSMYPSLAPSPLPSQSPSFIPSDAPSFIPSDAPSFMPSVGPTSTVVEEDLSEFNKIVRVDGDVVLEDAKTLGNTKSSATRRTAGSQLAVVAMVGGLATTVISSFL